MGYKATLLDQRLNITSAVYYYDYDDLQVLNVQTLNGVSVATYENAADATAWGFETEVSGLITDNLFLGATYSYNNSEYGDYSSVDSTACNLGPERAGNIADPLCTTAQDLGGNEFPLSPEHKASAYLTYQWNLLTLDWSATLGYQYTGNQQLTPFNDSLYDTLESYDLWDLRMNISDADFTWEFTAFIQNIADDREEIFRSRPSPVSGLAGSTLSDPRTYGLKLTYNF